MSGKRAHDFGDGDDPAKRIRSNNGSPAPALAAAPKVGDDTKRKAAERIASLQAKLAGASKRGNNVTTMPGPPGPPVEAMPAAVAQTVAPPAVQVPSSVEQKRAEALRQIAEFTARSSTQRNDTRGPPTQRNDRTGPPIQRNDRAGPPTQRNNGPAPPVKFSAPFQKSHGFQTGLAEAKARAADLAARTRSTAPPSSTTQEQVTADLQKRIEEARARTAQAKAQRENKASTPTAPFRQESTGPGSGLGIGIHPSLLNNQDQAGAKSSGTPQNEASEEQKEKVNPYLPAENEAAARWDAAVFDPKLIRRTNNRTSKPLAFVAQGKYIAQSLAIKEQTELEAMKRRIALETKKIAIELASDQSFLVPEPPEIEWWDAGLLEDDCKSYDDWEHHNRIEAADSIIKIYVQHPVLVAAPQDRLMPAPKPLMLTTKEMQKLRRQRRMAVMKEEQAKIRLGLVEPPPPKVKKSNMMRVYGEQAVKDPTAVEARVNREIAQRAEDHERDNEARKLTKTQRAEKLKRQQAGDQAKGIKIAIFRIDSLSSGKHRFQIDINAKQNDLRGIVILHPEMNLVVIEGGAHSVNHYKKLMLNRIKWAENTMPLSSNSNATFTATAAREASKKEEQGPNAVDTWLNPLTERGELKDLSENRCLLVWEGDEREQSFRKWGSRVCETDGEARDVLARSKMGNMWDLAKSTTE